MKKILFTTILFALGCILRSKKLRFNSILPPNNMNTDNQSLYAKLKNFLVEHEGWRNTAYKDSAGHWTIGIGHRILNHQKQLIDRKITDHEVMRLFENDTAKPLMAIREGVDVPINTNQAVALTSFIFNVGVHNWETSTLKMKLNLGEPLELVAKEFPRWKYITNPETGKKEVSAGLLNRRKKEAELFLST